MPVSGQKEKKKFKKGDAIHLKIRWFLQSV